MQKTDDKSRFMRLNQQLRDIFLQELSVCWLEVEDNNFEQLNKQLKNIFDRELSINSWKETNDFDELNQQLKDIFNKQLSVKWKDI